MGYFGQAQPNSLPTGELRFGSPFQFPQQSTSPLQGMWMPPHHAAHLTGSPKAGMQSRRHVLQPGSTVESGKIPPSQHARAFSQVGQHPNQPLAHPVQAINDDVEAATLGTEKGHDRANVQDDSLHVSAADSEIATPIPGHHHNVSETLQKEIDDAEYHLEQSIQQQLDADDGFKTNPTSPFDTGDMFLDEPPTPKLNGGVQDQSRYAFGASSLVPEDERAVRSNSMAILHHPQPHSRAHSLSKPDYMAELETKPSASKLNVEAKEFQFDSGNSQPKFDSKSSFTPGNFSFTQNTFQPSSLTSKASTQPRRSDRPAPNPRRGNDWNVEAPVFQPGQAAQSSVPSSTFSFEQSFRPDAPSFKPGQLDLGKATATLAVTDLANKVEPKDAKIFNFAEIIKPTKESNAVPIVRPDEMPPVQSKNKEQDGQEDESGRITQADGRQKRMRHGADDGDDVPQFATPTHPLTDSGQIQTSVTAALESSILSGKQDADQGDVITNADAQGGQTSVSLPGQDSTPATEVQGTLKLHDLGESDQDMEELSVLQADLAALGARPESTDALSKDAIPFQNGNLVRGIETTESNTDNAKALPPLTPPEPEEAMRSRSIFVSETMSSLPDSSPPTISAKEQSAAAVDSAGLPEGVAEREADSTVDDALVEPDAYDLADTENRPPSRRVVKDEEVRHHQSQDERLPVLESPSPSQQLQPSNVARSGGPSPSPHRGQQLVQPQLPIRPGRLFDENPTSVLDTKLAHDSPVRRINTPLRDTHSDWDDVVSPSEEHKFHDRSAFFGNRVDNLVGGLLESRIKPIEKTLRTMQDSLAIMAATQSSRHNFRRSTSAEAVDSDADDEDDEDEQKEPFPQRAKSPRKDRKLDMIRGAVLDALAAHQPTSQAPDLARMHEELYTMHEQNQLQGIRSMMEEVVGKQMPAISMVSTAPNAEAVTLLQLRISEQDEKLKDGQLRLEKERLDRKAAEDRFAESQAALRMAREEQGRLREFADEKERMLRVTEEKRHQDVVQAQMRSALLEGAHETLQAKATDLSVKNTALEASVREANVAEDRYRVELERFGAEKAEVRRTMDALKMQMEESIRVREGMRGKFDRMQEDMATASSDFAREQAQWRKREEEHRVRQEVLGARLEAEARTRERLEREIERLETQELEAMRMRVQVEQVQNANVQLRESIKAVQMENMDHRRSMARYEGEFNEAREAGRAEVRRTRTLMEADVEAANNQVNVVRASLESQLERLTTEFEQARKSHQRDSEEAADAKRRALHEARQAHEAALNAQRETYERHVDDLKAQSDRNVNNALDDKQRAETHLLERLGLSNAKTEHFQDKVAHLEEKLEIAKSAAHAAVQAVQTKTGGLNGSAVTASIARASDVPEKVSPQALRESILVLQEQLQEREARIEKLEQELSEVDLDAPTKIKDCETEIAWLRELLGVRIGDLEDIIRILSQPDYDGEAVKDAAIRLKANLQMEQQERERAMAGGQTFPSLASISSFASPKAVLPLAAAWGSWRKGRDLSLGSISEVAGGSVQTPSKSSPSAQSFLSGLLTPPNTSARQTPHGSGASQGRRRPSSRFDAGPQPSSTQSLRQREKQPAQVPPATPPLLRKASYDQDAETGSFGTSGFYDDDESTVDGNAAESRGEIVEPFGPKIGI